MQWYLAKLVFRIDTQKDETPGQFEEQLRLFAAENEKEAFQKAAAWGEKEEASFVNTAGRQVKWEFIAVPELHRLPGFTDGIALNSHLEEMPATEEYIALQRDKHTKLLLQSSRPDMHDENALQEK